MTVTFQNHGGVAQGGSVSSLAITKPTGTVAGALLIAHVGGNRGVTSRTFSAPDASWIKIQEDSNNPVHAAVFWKLAGASEPTDYNFSANNLLTHFSGVIGRWTGHDPAAPINVSAKAEGLADAVDTPSVITTVDNCRIVSFLARATESSTIPTGWTERWADINGGHHHRGATRDALQTTAGATGTATWGGSGTAAEYIVFTLAIAPAAPATTFRRNGFQDLTGGMRG